ncbi:hypothetical protein BS47DRAFT_1287271, partial [Hydnum rufescens UP504]
FKCSDTYIRKFLHTHLHWSMHTSTCATQKTLANWLGLCEDIFMWLAYYIKMFDVPAELVINVDQTGVCLIPARNKTWVPTGSKQVNTFGKEEKQQFTLMVASSAAGDLLPFQAIIKGKTLRSLPSNNSQAEGEQMGIIWTLGGENHWSSLKAMKMWMNDVPVPHIERVKKWLGLPVAQKAILVINSWSVHIGKDYREWMRQEHIHIKINYIPAGCAFSPFYLRSFHH